MIGECLLTYYGGVEIDHADGVFRGLNDASRRVLLDALFERDGQTLRELCAHLPDMTRYGVMNHLRVLAEAGLVTTTKSGREKYHYLNPVPIREVHDRWISKFAGPVADAMLGLRRGLEDGPKPRPGGRPMSRTESKPNHVYETMIRCTPEAAWQAMVDGDKTVQYFYGTRVESSFEPGAPIVYTGADGEVVADGSLLTVDEPKVLEMTFHPRWDPELEAEGPVRVIWRITDAGGLTSVRAEYYDMEPGSRTYEDFVGGIVFIVSGMKTLLETGEPLAG